MFKKTLKFWEKCAIYSFWQGVLNATKFFQGNDSDRRENKNLSVESISKGHPKKPFVHNINGLRNQKRARSPSPLSDHPPMLLKKRQHKSLDADAEDDGFMSSYWWRQHESCWIWFHGDYGWRGVDKAGERDEEWDNDLEDDIFCQRKHLTLLNAEDWIPYRKRWVKSKRKEKEYAFSTLLSQRMPRFTTVSKSGWPIMPRVLMLPPNQSSLVSVMHARSGLRRHGVSLSKARRPMTNLTIGMLGCTSN